jgi:hypothetical protein
MDDRELRMDSEMDRMLRSSLAAPVPTLSPDFSQRVANKVRAAQQSSRPLDRYRQFLLAGYALVSSVTCAVLMRDQGLGWTATAGLILAPLALVAAARLTPRVKWKFAARG